MMVLSWIWNCIIRDKKCPYCGYWFTLEEWKARDRETNGHYICKSNTAPGEKRS